MSEASESPCSANYSNDFQLSSSSSSVSIIVDDRGTLPAPDIEVKDKGHSETKEASSHLLQGSVTLGLELSAGSAATDDMVLGPGQAREDGSKTRKEVQSPSMQSPLVAESPQIRRKLLSSSSEHEQHISFRTFALADDVFDACSNFSVPRWLCSFVSTPSLHVKLGDFFGHVKKPIDHEDSLFVSLRSLSCPPFELLCSFVKEHSDANLRLVRSVFTQRLVRYLSTAASLGAGDTFRLHRWFLLSLGFETHKSEHCGIASIFNRHWRDLLQELTALCGSSETVTASDLSAFLVREPSAAVVFTLGSSSHRKSLWQAIQDEFVRKRDFSSALIVDFLLRSASLHMRKMCRRIGTLLLLIVDGANADESEKCLLECFDIHPERASHIILTAKRSVFAASRLVLYALKKTPQALRAQVPVRVFQRAWRSSLIMRAHSASSNTQAREYFEAQVDVELTSRSLGPEEPVPPSLVDQLAEFLVQSKVIHLRPALDDVSQLECIFSEQARELLPHQLFMNNNTDFKKVHLLARGLLEYCEVSESYSSCDDFLRLYTELEHLGVPQSSVPPPAVLLTALLLCRGDKPYSVSLCETLYAMEQFGVDLESIEHALQEQLKDNAPSIQREDEQQRTELEEQETQQQEQQEQQEQDQLSTTADNDKADETRQKRATPRYNNDGQNQEIAEKLAVSDQVQSAGAYALSEVASHRLHAEKDETAPLAGVINRLNQLEERYHAEKAQRDAQTKSSVIASEHQ
ncbi:MAG: hypothetical protein MHM6MM_004902 [Cercozoa sp. M6MM]